jgi:hypothetical protein
MRTKINKLMTDRMSNPEVDITSMVSPANSTTKPSIRTCTAACIAQ